MPKNNLKIRKATSEDIPLIREMLIELLHIPTSEGYFRWRFFDSPLGTPPMAVAIDTNKNKCVGFYTGWLWEASLNKQIILCASPMDVVVHPDYRGGGLFVALGEKFYALAEEEGCKFTFNFPNDNSYSGGIKRLNWDHVGDVDFWVRPIKPLRGALSIFNFLALVFGFCDRFVVKSRNYSIKEDVPSIPALQTMLDKMESEKDVCEIHYTAKWLLWRHSNKSEKDYRWICAYKGKELKGFITWRFSSPHDGKIIITKLMGIEGGASMHVLCELIKRCYRENIRALMSFESHPEVVSFFKSLGFIKISKKTPARLIVRKLTARTLPANIHNHKIWRLSGCDMDFM